MSKPVLPLTDAKVKNAKAEGKDIKLFDGGGLFLLVGSNGSKGWRLKYKYGGKEKSISLGMYPGTSLAEAREKRQEAKKLLDKGIDPSTERKIRREEIEARQVRTFKRVAEDWIDNKTDYTPKTRKMTQRRLELDVFPSIGAIPISDLTPRLILEGVLRPMERRGVVELAHRTKSIISRVLRYGVGEGYVERDLTADLRGVLKPFKRKHMAATIDPKGVGAILRAIDSFQGTVVVHTALQLHPLVATRPGELRSMEWTEVDLDEGIWTIPAGKMKMKNAHSVPLSRQAMDLLRHIYSLTGRGRYVFPSIRTVSKPISDNTLNASLRSLGIGKEEMTSHGWRAVFRTLADEALGERVDHIEHQLAHSVKDTNGRAYNRTSFLPERRAMMQKWADYLDHLKAK